MVYLVQKRIFNVSSVGVNAVIIPGMDIKSSRQGYAIACRYPGYAFFTAGKLEILIEWYTLLFIFNSLFDNICHKYIHKT